MAASHLAALVLAAVVLSAVPVARAQAASAPGPAPAAPKTITAILTKAGQFTKFLQLLQSTREAEQITNQLKGKSSNGGLTVFAPPDNAFTALPVGTLNSLTDQQKTSLVQFHVVSMVMPASQLETVSNPLRTQAGDTGPGKYPLNITADGTNVNVSTGVVNATLDGTPLYAGDRLVVYQVNKVLLPWALYGPALPPSPAPAPAPADSKKKTKAAPGALADAPAADTAAGTTASEAARGVRGVGAGSCVAVAVAAATWWGI
ncbi:Fasciclin-like arabinogalactan protein 11 [Dichanthelium oligosanthes]|uniref:Fasciclin-like arabinogalactan protein 11 n=1 Tax=Dichanthelium oligosanthes TaxID=888268 RepID=A0A1E5W3R5_9POAL|nr:Fasciclin-like arabinogalactan protein 11 [Dichanthelium oligosanthes]